MMSEDTVRLGVWVFHVRDGMIVCSNCGKELKNIDIRSCETGHAYCSNECAREDVLTKMKAKKKVMQG